MADLPISGLPAITVPSNSYLLAAVSASVTTQMTLAQVAAAMSSSFTASRAISASYATSASYEINYETSSSYADTASVAVSASYALTASYALNSGVGSTFPYTGSAQITGSLGVTGSINGVLISGESSTMRIISSGSADTNIAIGLSSLANITTGTSNTMVGQLSGYNTTTGTRNTYIGRLAGWDLDTGSYNTFIGVESSIDTLTPFGPDRNIIISDGLGVVRFSYSYLTNTAKVSGSLQVTGNLNVTGSISQTSVTSSLIKANANGTLVAAVGGIDYTPTAYLSAFHTASLTVPSPNTPNTMSFSTVDFAQGVTISGSWSDKIKVANGGVYNLQFSAATTKTTGTAATVDIWLRKNESDLSYTNTIVTLAGGANDFAVPAWNFFVSASAGDYYQLMFASPTTNPYIAYSPSGSTGVAVQVPSVILTVNRIA